MTSTRIRARLDDEAGAAAVEFALVLVLLVMLLLGITQFGVTLARWEQVIHAAREGARWASLQKSETEVKDAVVKAASSITDLDYGDITISPSGYTDATARNNPVTVTVKCDPAVISPFFAGIFSAAGVTELSSSATLRVE